MDFAHMAMRGAIAYSAFRRSKTHLVYTTEDLRVRFVDRTHFFGRAHPEKRAYALPIGKVGLEQQVLTPAECLALEPALRLATRDLAGGIFTASEQVGDCAAFCSALSSHMRQRNNIAWSLRTPIVGPVCSGGRLVAVETDKGRVQADCFVLCLGSQSRTFARACGFYLPIYPLI